MPGWVPSPWGPAAWGGRPRRGSKTRNPWPELLERPPGGALGSVCVPPGREGRHARPPLGSLAWDPARSGPLRSTFREGHLPVPGRGTGRPFADTTSRGHQSPTFEASLSPAGAASSPAVLTRAAGCPGSEALRGRAGGLCPPTPHPPRPSTVWASLRDQLDKSPFWESLQGEPEPRPPERRGPGAWGGQAWGGFLQHPHPTGG